MAKQAEEPLVRRYARALFELARDKNSLEAVAKDLAQLDAMLDQSPELVAALCAPVYTRASQARLLEELAQKAGFHPYTCNFLRLLAQKRRQGLLRNMLRAFQELQAEARGDIRARLTSARPLSAELRDRLCATLAAGRDRHVHLDERVEPALLGGFVLKLGSHQIDMSIRTKLDRLFTWRN